MTNRKWKPFIAVLVVFQAASLYAQDEKPAPKRPPARPVNTAKPAEPAKDVQPKPKTSSTTVDMKQMPTQATAEMIMNEAVKNIAKRYNLNEAQKQKTDEIMKRDVNKFLKDHEAQVWPIIRDLMSNGFQPPANPEDVKRIGNAAAPLVKEAQKAILDGNKEWRQYLTPEQQAMHDYDLGEMEKQFVEAEKSFRSWAEGKPMGGLFPAPPLDRSPPTPKMPTAGLPKPPPPPEPEVEIFVRENLFDSYVEDFIKQYELDPAQIDAARSILAETKLKAGDFKESNRAELTKVAHEHKAAMDARDRDRIAKAEADRKKLLEPVYVLFTQMDERLKALLTSSQLERHGPKQPDVAKADLLAPASPPVQAAPPPSAPPRAADKANAGDPPPQKPESPKTTP